MKPDASFFPTDAGFLNKCIKNHFPIDNITVSILIAKKVMVTQILANSIQFIPLRR